jgi:hypothetical protein
LQLEDLIRAPAITTVRLRLGDAIPSIPPMSTGLSARTLGVGPNVRNQDVDAAMDFVAVSLTFVAARALIAEMELRAIGVARLHGVP